MSQYRLFLVTCIVFSGSFSAKGQTVAADNRVSESITFRDIPRGKGVYGIFEGRTPCFELRRQLAAAVSPDCDHLKWQLILFRDSVTLKPTTYILSSELFDRRPIKGKWIINHGKKADPAAILIALEYGQGKMLYLLKGDENVLFFLDERLELLVGNQDYNYTLNRVRKVRHLSGE